MTNRRADLFVDFDADPRVEPPPVGDERATLVGFLRWQRHTLELKCSDLDAARLARRSVEPSTIGPPRAFRTADLDLFHAARCRFRYSVWTSCGVL